MHAHTPPDDGAHTPLTDDERAGLIPQHLATRSELNQWEGVNIAQAYRWLTRRRRRDVLSVGFLQELHRRMFGQTWEWAGTYRRSDNNISPYAWHVVPVMVRELVENTRARHDASDKSASTLDDIVMRFHYELVRIHPWPNGNGRHARLAADQLAMQWGQPPFTWGGSADLTDTGDARSRYIDALRTADEGDKSALRVFARS